MLWAGSSTRQVSAMAGAVPLLEICAVHESVHGPKRQFGRIP
jgi:hypothetical protein